MMCRLIFIVVIFIFLREVLFGYWVLRMGLGFWGLGLGCAVFSQVTVQWGLGEDKCSNRASGDRAAPGFDRRHKTRRIP